MPSGPTRLFLGDGAIARKFLNGIDASNQRIINVGTPSTSTDATNKTYVDNLVSGLQWHQSVRVASTANITISSPGTTIDGVTLSSNDRVLLKNQTTGSENGVYQFNGSSSAMTRTSDGTQGNLGANSTFLANEGTVNADTAWTATTNSPITVGTTAIVFAQFGGGITYTAGNGISISSNVVTVVATTGISVGGSGVGVDFSIVPKKYAVAIGDGSSTTITVTHNLSTRDVKVCVYDASTFDVVEADINHATTNTVTVAFATAPSSNAYRCVVHG